MAKTKTLTVQFELVEYLSYFAPVVARGFLIWSF